MEHTESGKSIKPFMDRINFIFHGIIAVPLLVFVWLYLEANANRMTPMLEGTTLDIVVFTLPLAIFVLSALAFRRFKNELKTINKTDNLEKKLAGFYSASLVKYMLLEGALILSVVGFWLSLSVTFVTMFIIVLVFFSLIKPTPQRIVKALGLEDDEKDHVLNKHKQ